ncbi:hypothetical protein OUZ56_020907 [Daphnia magna]|uniref:Uncharacterized protein n=2 Tax=Daphnia magna TaxID=35525 RepID=A0ABQ9ZFY4_9CRUS|nr:hypothetical protein OUZ56_020907 [Daphnia magna]
MWDGIVLKRTVGEVVLKRTFGEIALKRTLGEIALKRTVGENWRNFDENTVIKLRYNYSITLAKIFKIGAHGKIKIHCLCGTNRNRASHIGSQAHVMSDGRQVLEQMLSPKSNRYQIHFHLINSSLQ